MKTRTRAAKVDRDRHAASTPDVACGGDSPTAGPASPALAAGAEDPGSQLVAQRSKQQEQENKFNHQKQKSIMQDFNQLFLDRMHSGHEEQEEQEEQEDATAGARGRDTVRMDVEREDGEEQEGRDGLQATDAAGGGDRAGTGRATQGGRRLSELKRHNRLSARRKDERGSKVKDVLRHECRCASGILPPEWGLAHWHVVFGLANETLYNQCMSHYRGLRSTMSMWRTSGIPPAQDMRTCALIHLLHRDAERAVKWLVRLARMNYCQRKEVWCLLAEVATVCSGVNSMTSALLSCILTLYDEHEKRFAESLDESDAVRDEDCLRHAQAADVCIVKAVVLICQVEDDPQAMCLLVKPLHHVVHAPLQEIGHWKAAAACRASGAAGAEVDAMSWMRDVVARTEAALPACTPARQPSACAEVAELRESLQAHRASLRHLSDTLVSGMKLALTPSTIRSSELPAQTMFENEFQHAQRDGEWYTRESMAASKAEQAVLRIAQEEMDRADEARMRKMRCSLQHSAVCGAAARAAARGDDASGGAPSAASAASKAKAVSRAAAPGSPGPVPGPVPGPGPGPGAGAAAAASGMAESRPAYSISGVARLIHTRPESACSSIQSIVSALSTFVYGFVALEHAVQVRWKEQDRLLRTHGAREAAAAEEARGDTSMDWVDKLVGADALPAQEVDGALAMCMALLHATCDPARCRGVHLSVPQAGSGDAPGQERACSADPVRHLTEVITKDMSEYEKQARGRLRSLDSLAPAQRALDPPARRHQDLGADVDADGSSWDGAASERAALAVMRNVLLAALSSTTLHQANSPRMWASHPRSAAWTILLQACRGHFLTLCLACNCIALSDRGLLRNQSYGMALCLSALHTRAVLGGHCTAWTQLRDRGQFRLLQTMSDVAQSDTTAFQMLGAGAQRVLRSLAPQLSARGEPKRPPQAYRQCVAINPAATLHITQAPSPLHHVSSLPEYGGDPMFVFRRVGGTSAPQQADVGKRALGVSTQAKDHRHQVELFGRRLSLSCALLASQSECAETRAICVHNATLANAVSTYQASVFTLNPVYAAPVHGDRGKTLSGEELDAYERVVVCEDEDTAEARLKMFCARERLQQQEVAGMGEVWESEAALQRYKESQSVGPEFPFDLPPEEVEKNERNERARRDRERKLMAKGKGAAQQASSAQASSAEEVVVVDTRVYKPDNRNAKLGGPLYVPAGRLFCMKELEKRGHQFQSSPLPEAYRRELKRVQSGQRGAGAGVAPAPTPPTAAAAAATPPRSKSRRSRKKLTPPTRCVAVPRAAAADSSETQAASAYAGYMTMLDFSVGVGNRGKKSS